MATGTSPKGLKAVAGEGQEDLTNDPPSAVDLKAGAAGTWQDQGGSAAVLCPGQTLQGSGGSNLTFLPASSHRMAPHPKVSRPQ